ncbi:MAG: redoxin domain-containing protein [Clostridia bacterium]|nr:redoxin domain-containing protein [Clostridia bacterium]
MKNSLKKLLALLLALTMLSAVVLQLVGCTGGNDDENDGGGGTPCTDHVDNDGDGVCDTEGCDATVEPDGSGGGDPCTDHVDNNGDGVCDTEGCNTPVQSENPGDDDPVTYDITIKTAGGMPMEGIMIYVWNADDTAMISRTETDENGRASISLTEKNCLIELDDYPDGYIVEDRYALSASGTNITLRSAPIKGSISDAKNGYNLGDVVHDFSYTDIDGNVYKVSEILKEKQLIVLNFWYTTCSYCYEEFPYLSRAYDKYSDMVEVLALNDYAPDSLEAVQNFVVYDKSDSLVDLNFPLFKIDETIIHKFDKLQQGYPVTVAIDRYGVVSMVHVGGVPSEKYFTNMFDYFTSDNYVQKLTNDIADFTPVVKPDVEMPTSDALNEVLTENGMNGSPLNVTYRADEDEYSWPFVITTFDGFDCVKPSNTDIDNSFSILYADVHLEAGEALMFDYFSSTELGKDILYMIVDGQDIYNISGLSSICDVNIENPDPEHESTCTEHNDTDGDGLCDVKLWEKCCTFVARYAGTYEVAFAYIKDISDYSGDDTIYIKNLRGVPEKEVDVPTYIFREAATELNEYKDGFNSYANIVYNSADGYYHVGAEDGPLLLANLLLYTQFDSKKTVFERFYADVDADGNPIFTVNGLNKANSFEMYGSYASNSDLYGYAPVTAELKEMLIAHVEKYATLAGGWLLEENPDLWLALCVYYDAYGTDGKQLEDPIKGLASFSAYDAVLGENTEDNVINIVEYDRLLIPRGHLYAFTPEVSGVYRVTSNSSSSVIGWIFQGNHDVWAERGDRSLLISSDSSRERIVDDLIVLSHYTVYCTGCGAPLTLGIGKTEVSCSDPVCGTVMSDIPEASKIPVYAKDYNNISMLAYLEADVTYYISVAFHNTEETGSFTFDLTYEGESFKKFVEASPGAATADMDASGNFGEIRAGGIDYKLCDDDSCSLCAEAALEAGAPAGTKYYHHLIHNEDGSTTLGQLIYADFHMYTSIFTSQSITDLIKINAFNFSITENDRDALQYIEDMHQAGKTALYEKWDTENGTPMTQYAKDQRWAAYDMDNVVWGDYSNLTDEEKAVAEEWKAFVDEKGLAHAKKILGDSFDAIWKELKVEEVMQGIFHPTKEDMLTSLDRSAIAYITPAYEVAKGRLFDTLQGTDADKAELWERYDMDNAIWGDYSGLSEELKAQAEPYVDTIHSYATEYLSDLWGDDFLAYMEHYQIDDVMNGIYHGNTNNYTEAMKAYAAMMSDDPDNHPERQGCVAVDENLAIILQRLCDKYWFENVDGAWRKLCYYYEVLGA